MSKQNAVYPLRQNSLNFCLVLTTIFFVFGCLCPSERNTSTNHSPSINNNISIVNSSNSGQIQISKEEKTDSGDFIVQHGTSDKTEFKEFDGLIKNKQILENAAGELNKNLKLPKNVYLQTKDCNEVNALYDPNDNSITICYELMRHYYSFFKNKGKSDTEAKEKMFDALRFVFLHEVGHAMIDLYQLPITGSEEDAADRVSAYICLEEIEGGVSSIMAVADTFSANLNEKNAEKRDLANEHLLQEQRFYNSLCMIYGSDTVKYEHLIKQGYLPKERALRCPSEYERTMKSWQELLKPWRKKG